MAFIARTFFHSILVPLLLISGIVEGVMTPGTALAQPGLVVRAGDVKVTAKQLSQEFAFLPPPQLQRLHDDDNAARLFAVKWYSDLLFELDARRSGFLEKEPGVKATADSLAREVVSRAYLENLMTSRFEPNEAELEQVYQLERQQLCRRPARYRIARAGVLLGQRASEEERAATLSRMDRMVERLEGGEPFGVVADELSDLAGKKPGGEIGWMTEFELGSAEGADEVTKLATGEFTAPVDTAQGRVVYAMLERSEAGDIDYKACRPLLLKALQERYARDIKLRRVDELATELGGTMNIGAFIEAIRAVPVPAGWQQTWGPANP